jgi:copper chaperone CopZ
LKKKAAKVTKKIAAVKKPSTAAGQSSEYDLPAVSGTVSQTYAVEEGIGEPEVGNLVGALKGIGAQDAYADTSRNTLTVTFDSAKVTSAGIIKKLKTLGYTAKRQQ